MLKSKITILLLIAALSLTACTNNVSPPPASSSSSEIASVPSSEVLNEPSSEPSSSPSSEPSSAPSSKPSSEASSQASSAPTSKASKNVNSPIGKAADTPSSKTEILNTSAPASSKESSENTTPQNAAANKTVNLPTAQPEMVEIADAIFLKVNDLRTSLGLAPYTRSSLLDDSSLIRSAEMYGASNMSHTRPNGELYQTAMDEVGYQYDAGKENIALANDYPLDQLAETFFQGWKNSPSHYVAMIAPNLTEMGIALYGDVANCFATQHFANPK